MLILLGQAEIKMKHEHNVIILHLLPINCDTLQTSIHYVLAKRTVFSITAIERKGLTNSIVQNKAMMKSPLPLRTL